MNTATVADLGRIVGSSNVEVRPATLVPYRTDATFGFSGTPSAVVRPGRAEEVAQILAWADQRRVPVVPRGAGTSLAAGAVPIHGGIVLALTRMNRILSIDPVDLTAVVQPSVTTQDLARAAGEHGLHYPPDPGSAAGTYAILRRRDSQRVLAAKLAALADLDLDFLVVVNPGCQRQLMTAVRRAGLRG